MKRHLRGDTKRSGIKKPRIQLKKSEATEEKSARSPADKKGRQQEGESQLRKLERED